jgi:Na+-translocating ferredoxin:NAD+ oxidoreductase RnfA subunit
VSVVTLEPPPPRPPAARDLILNGILTENPVFRLALSLCPAVAVTTTVMNGLILGIAVLMVQVLSSGTVALVRGFIHPRVRIPVYTVIIAVWVSAIDMLLAAFLPALYAQVGLYVKLIVAFAIIISRLEVFASRYPLVPSLWDALGMGLGFLMALVVIGALRELLGGGSLLGIQLTPDKPLLFFALPAGGFFSIALLMALINAVERRFALSRLAASNGGGGGGGGGKAAGAHVAALALVTIAALAAPAQAAREPVVRGIRIEAPDRVRISLARPLARTDAANFRLTEASAPDVAIGIRAVRSDGPNVVVLTAERKLDGAAAYRLEIADPPAAREVLPSAFAVMLAGILSAALINNFVFTRYLGLCIFFGISKKRDTALGMGITFTAVMVTTAMLSWLLYSFVMKPLELRFLQVLAFIGIVAFLVQLLDTVLKKTHRGLHKRFGIYLMLITTNCIILAVPLLNAAADAGPLESFALAMGSGFGFALALFLMSCARERVELARVPPIFQGLPIAFALAGLFALAFMGFSGLSFFR